MRAVQVEVVRSVRRNKTVSWRPVGGVLRVSIPAWMSAEDEAHWVARAQARFRRATTAEDLDLPARADEVARQYNLSRPSSIRWVSDQEHRWGSCTPSTGTIRISDRLAAFPPWVLDYVIVHELAHLWEPGHTRAFWATVSRYPLAERARGFLIAKGLEPDQ